MAEPMENKTQSVLTILAAVSARGMTGMLRFEPEPANDHHVEFLFREGKLLFATSNQPGERLAEFLVRRQILSNTDAKKGLLEAKKEGKLFHVYLVEQGLLDPDLLKDLLYQRTEELLDMILQADDGRFVFRPAAQEQLDVAAPGVDEELFGRLLKHRNVWPAVYQKFRDPALVLRCQPGIEAAISFHSMGEAERRLLGLIDGQRTVGRILERRRNRIDLMILLERFLEAGLIEVVDASQGPPPSEPALLDTDGPRLETPAPTAPAASAEEAAGSAQAGDGVDLDMVPVLAPGVDVAQMSITGLMMDDLFLISQIDGKASVRELQFITQMDEQKLQKVMGRVLQKGYVTLHTRFAPEPPVKRSRPGIQVELYTPEPGPAAEQRPAAAAAPRPPADPKEHAQQLYAQALEAYNAQDFFQAERLLRRALELHPRSAPIRARLALVMIEKPGRDREAELMAEEAFEEDPLQGQCLEAMGLIKVKFGEYDAAKRLLEKATLLDRKSVPSSARVLAELKGYQPKKGDSAEEFWWKMRKHITLTT